MEHFIVSARKYRPKNFEDVVGQLAITNTLENAIKNNHLAQALLFTGPRGVGKTSCARILAKKINQHNVEISGDEDFAFNIFELDAASNNSVDDIRSLTDQVRIPPQTGKYKVYIIDEVHMLSQAAFNAFLKTLEEPPAHAIFILATTEKHKIIPTILSRCQIFDFKRIGVLDAKNYLKIICGKENITADDDALHIIAQKADGAMRDALSIFDRVVSFSGKNLTREAVTENLNVLDYDTYFNMTGLLLENKIPDVLNAFNTILGKGFEGHHFINGLASHFRDLLVAKDKATLALLEVGDTAKKKYLEQATKASIPFLMQSISKANDCDLNYRSSKNQRLLVELTLMQIASITFDGEKKKSANYIIPATFFQALSPAAKEISKPIQKKPEAVQSQKLEEPKPKVKTPVLKSAEKRSSSLSLKSIHQKKQEKKLVVEENFDNHPKTIFTEKLLQQFWKEYVDLLNKKGERSMASIVGTDVPRLKQHFKISFTVPNKLMQDQFKKGRPKLLNFLREKLNNYGIKIDAILNETVEKKFAYTPLEKFNKLKEKNPLLEKLRQSFELDM
ncbi:MAG: DNA polymerase III subunit gamma/tau [Polaribacter sp.]|jgi:DNA polymerase III subunit gamma/tau|uniref:DNA polymerase III subunit gamma/tau n=1 Tax=unclassified Polaribacter TaxID=196858 RepID=UPI000C7007D0|nr:MULTISPECIES: DNA polymerase III subunit gamma/tau [unclassified Polaribacter]MBT3740676.1 DNA polymerase III subunit gamma/tau [Polaribacter sp.]MDG1195918.1 DNA polymerase III subunit gamma/tau [Polaribacter sp.]MDG1403265.1 DNA polymerase III subunit gamma/tau [Polaribacter sp.]PKV64887.1 DNA polymerase-3 subunit gamma/tau [Polaribacter sp. Hel1_33_96]